MDFFYATLGLVILLLAGDSLVRGAVNLSLRLGVPALIVSLTVVAFGTSAPELLIGIKAVLDKVPGLAMGNVVGSNTANVLLVLGVPALITGLHTADCDTRRNYLSMLAATVLFMVLATGGVFGFWQGLTLLAGLGLMLTSAFQEALSHRRKLATERRAALEAAGAIVDPEALEAEAEAEAEAEEEGEVEGADPDMPWAKVILFLVLGMIGLPLGADILVDASTSIARDFGMSETVIGLTLVALGTSLPELATTVMAAMRRQADVALGNVIGSNMFNLLAIIGISALVGPIPVEPGMLRFDLWVMLASSLLLAPFVFRGWHMGRSWGIVFCGLYLVYVVVLLGG
ncbi:calcium/sodium antiporter [Maritimibacter fusiformis]|uniref:Calcium/sodium antiporter n=1 Tax=Maritimibacter fusiformis TaxID=2603819 RepID=A0A5D0RKV8_9RHOB|nr:calcium/sodium antiporter [Maritimibacter fusiformis]TYB82073.1 calcium/sodium antiporter [Maritimibacter fusiformis]